MTDSWRVRESVSSCGESKPEPERNRGAGGDRIQRNWPGGPDIDHVVGESEGGMGDAHAHTEHEGGGEEGWHSAAGAAVRSMVQRSKQR